MESIAATNKQHCIGRRLSIHIILVPEVLCLFIYYSTSFCWFYCLFFNRKPLKLILNYFCRWCQRCFDSFVCLDLTVALCMCKVWLDVIHYGYKSLLGFSVVFYQKIKTTVIQSGKKWIVIHVLCTVIGIVYLQKEPSKSLSNSMQSFK